MTLVKSTIGFDKKQAKVVEGLGLRRIGHAVELADTPATRQHPCPRRPPTSPP